MKLLKTRFAIILATAVLCLAIVGGVAYAASVSKTVPTQGNVVPSAASVEAYSDILLTTPLTGIAWGDVIQGESTTVEFYVKNTGNRRITSLFVLSDVDTNMATLTLTPTSSSLDKGQATKVTAVLAAKAAGTTGACNPTITITANY